jgi:hypothetical protein
MTDENAPSDPSAEPTAFDAALRQMLTMLAVAAPAWPTAAVETVRDSWTEGASACFEALRGIADGVAAGEDPGRRRRVALFLVAIASEKGDARLVDAMAPCLTAHGAHGLHRFFGVRTRDLLHGVARIGPHAVGPLAALESSLDGAEDALRTWVAEARSVAEAGAESLAVEDAMWFDLRRTPPWERTVAPPPLVVQEPDREAVLARRRAQKARRRGR